MFTYYFPQFIDGDADLRMRIQGEGDQQRYFLGTQQRKSREPGSRDFT
jgi:hypothetical protein